MRTLAARDPPRNQLCVLAAKIQDHHATKFRFHAPCLILYWFCCARHLGHHQVYEFVRHEDMFYHALPVKVRSYAWFGLGQRKNLFFRHACCYFQFSTHPPVDLHYDFHFCLARQFRIKSRPRRCPLPIFVPQHFPQFQPQYAASSAPA